MPIRLVSTTVRRARMGVTLADHSTAFTGTFTQAAGATGVVAASLANVTGSITGQFTGNFLRTGTIASALSNFTASIPGTFTAPGAPVSPAGLTSAFVSGTSVLLDWSDNPPTGLVNYKVWRSTTSASSGFTVRATITTGSPLTSTYTDTVVQGTRYWWYVTAGNASVDSVPSAVVTSPVGWLTISTQSIDRALPFPQYINNVRATYLIDPAGLVTSVDLLPLSNAVSAVVPLYDASNTLIGYGPSASPNGVFYGVTGMANGDLWWVLEQPTTGATVTALIGGDFTATGNTGTHVFTWERWTAATGVTTTGTKSFTM